jgi:phytoene dehydrogenase-like protein
MNSTVLAKEFVQKTLDEMPDDVSVEEIIKELAFKRMVERGLQDSLNDRVISQEQLEKQIASLCCSEKLKKPEQL